LGKENIFKSIFGNYRLHDVTNENALRLEILASGGGLIVKNTMLPPKDIYVRGLGKHLMVYILIKLTMS